MPNDENVDSCLQDLKMSHDKLVDLILKEEDDLISDHHKFIENTINSGKTPRTSYSQRAGETQT